LFEVLWRSSLDAQLARMLEGDLRPERVHDLFRRYLDTPEEVSFANFCFPEAGPRPEDQILVLCMRSSKLDKFGALFQLMGLEHRPDEPETRDTTPVVLPASLERGLRVVQPSKQRQAHMALASASTQRHDPRAVLGFLFRCWYPDESDRLAMAQMAGLELASCHDVLADPAALRACLSCLMRSK
jgi:hypothetical protein